MHRHAQPYAEALQHLRRQADLRHQHQRLAATCQALGDRLQVDLGLAAARDAIEQQRREAATGGADRIDRRLLFRVGIQRRRRRGRALVRAERDAFDEAARGERAGGGAPTLDGRLQHRLLDGACGQAFGEPSRPARTQARQGGPSPLRQDPSVHVRVRQRFAATQDGGQRGRQHLPQRREQIARQPAQRGQQLAFQEGAVVEEGGRRA